MAFWSRKDKQEGKKSQFQKDLAKHQREKKKKPGTDNTSTDSRRDSRKALREYKKIVSSSGGEKTKRTKSEDEEAGKVNVGADGKVEVSGEDDANKPIPFDSVNDQAEQKTTDEAAPAAETKAPADREETAEDAEFWKEFGGDIQESLLGDDYTIRVFLKDNETKYKVSNPSRDKPLRIAVLPSLSGKLDHAIKKSGIDDGDTQIMQDDEKGKKVGFTGEGAKIFASEYKAYRAGGQDRPQAAAK